MMLMQIKSGITIAQSLRLLVGALLVLMLTGCATNPVTGESNFVMMSEAQEIEVGRKNHPQIIKEFGKYENDALQAYVQSVGARLAEKSHRSNLTYRFTVLDSPVVNAFALPGGYIYITRGLMSYLNSEAELAAVLGHEIGHVTARHGVRQQSAGQAAQLGYAIGALLLPSLRSKEGQQAFNMLGGALLSGYGRDHELESDRLGAQYLAKTGYDPQAMIEVIGVLKDQEIFAQEQAKKLGQKPRGYHGLFASHPDNDTRLQQVVGEAEQLRVSGQNKIGRQAYLQQIDGMVFGDSEAQGIRSGRHFYHGPMGFALDFPERWQIQNKPTKLVAVAPGGGAFLEVRVDDINRKVSPEEFMRTRLKIDRLYEGKKLRNHGLTGYTGVAKTQDGRPVRISVVYFRDQAFMFFGAVKDPKSFRQHDDAFIAAASSLRTLSRSEQHLAKAKRIKIVQVGSRDSYANWSRKSQISNSPLQQLRLLNDDYPSGELERGQDAKQIR
jgi:predicted Zn-dependent protease